MTRSATGERASQEAFLPPLVVLVHGTRDQGASFAAAAEFLPELNVLRYDRRGWGKAPGWDGAATDLSGHIDDVLGVLGERKASLVGHSWGGNVALGAALRRPDLITSLGLYETAMPWAEWWPRDHGAVIRSAVERSAAKPPGTARQMRERALFAAEAFETFAQPFDLGRLTVPCIAAYGSASFPLFESGVRAFARMTGAEIYEIAGASHLAHRQHPKEFADFVRRAVTLRDHREPGPG